MNSRPDLRLDWCSHQAAKYAVEHWHYSKTMPVSKSVNIGVWEDGIFIGAVIFAWGANPHLSKPYGCTMYQVAELVRVALTNHVCATSRVVAYAIKMIRQQSPGLRLLVSFADTGQNHHGGIYQAGNWIYTGTTSPKSDWYHGGRVLQRRAYTGQNFGRGRMTVPVGAQRIVSPPKHRYLMPLDAEMRARIALLAQPYPKRERSRENAAAPPSAEGGVIPTRSLQHP